MASADIIDTPTGNALQIWPSGRGSCNCLSLVSLRVHLPGLAKHKPFTISFSFFVKPSRSIKITALSGANFQFNFPSHFNFSPKKDMNNNCLPSTIRIQNLCLLICSFGPSAFPFIRVTAPLIALNIFTKHCFLVHGCSCLKNRNKSSSFDANQIKLILSCLDFFWQHVILMGYLGTFSPSLSGSTSTEGSTTRSENAHANLT